MRHHHGPARKNLDTFSKDSPMRPVDLDQRRTEFMEELYQRSGRTNGLFTGLWDEYSRKIAAKVRDTEQDDILQSILSD